RILDPREDPTEAPPDTDRESTRTGAPTSATRTVAGGRATTTPAARGPRRTAAIFGAAALALLVAAGAVSSRARKTAAPCADCQAPAAGRADGTCVPFASARCKVLADTDTARDPRTLWIGAMFPLSGPDADAFGKESVNAADLARQDFMRIAKGIPARAIGQPPRKIGLLACDDAEDAQATARHL